MFEQLVACYEGRIATLVFVFRFRVRINKVSADNVFVVVFRVSGFIKRFGVGVAVIAVRRIAFAVSGAGGFFQGPFLIQAVFSGICLVCLGCLRLTRSLEIWAEKLALSIILGLILVAAILVVV